MEALKILPSYRPELERRTPITGEGRELDRRIHELDERVSGIHEKASHYAETGALDYTEGTQENALEGTMAAMKEEQDQIEKQRGDLLIRKADYVRRRIYAKDLLDLISDITSTREEKPITYAEEIQRQVRAYPAKCEDVADFYERTSQRRHFGPVTEFDPADVIQYVQKIIVYEESLKVVFKAGIEIEVMG